MAGMLAPSAPLSFERFAALSAVVGAGPRAELLAEAGVSLATWRESQRHWIEQMAEEARAGRRGLADRWRALMGRRSPAAAVPQPAADPLRQTRDEPSSARAQALAALPFVGPEEPPTRRPAPPPEPHVLPFKPAPAKGSAR
jgi:hypothetical protein